MANRARTAAAPPEKLWTADELAAYLHVEVMTTHHWASQGKGPRWHKVGRQRLYDPADVKTWLDERASAPPLNAASA